MVENPGPSLATRALALVVLLIAAYVLLRVVVGLVAGLVWIVLLVVAVFGVLWAWRTLRR